MLSLIGSQKSGFYITKEEVVSFSEEIVTSQSPAFARQAMAASAPIPGVRGSGSSQHFINWPPTYLTSSDGCEMTGMWAFPKSAMGCA